MGKNVIKGDVTQNLKAGKFDFVSETKRLVIRPLRESDYETWLNGFEKPLSFQTSLRPGQNRYE